MYVLYLFFFFQAEDGIRDYKVTGVQTCALPISDISGGCVHVAARRKGDCARLYQRNGKRRQGRDRQGAAARRRIRAGSAPGVAPSALPARADRRPGGQQPEAYRGDVQSVRGARPPGRLNMFSLMRAVHQRAPGTLRSSPQSTVRSASAPVPGKPSTVFTARSRSSTSNGSVK